MYTRLATHKKSLVLLFAVFYGLAAILLILVLTVFWNNTIPDEKGNRSVLFSKDLGVQRAGNVLNGHLKALQALDQKYASLLSLTEINSTLNSVTRDIRKAEARFRNDIDSIDKASARENDIAGFNQLISFYKTALESRRYPDNMQEFIAAAGRQLSETKQQMDTLKQQLAKKDSLLAEVMHVKGLGRAESSEPPVSDADYNLLNDGKPNAGNNADNSVNTGSAHYNQTASAGRKSRTGMALNMKEVEKQSR